MSVFCFSLGYFSAMRFINSFIVWYLMFSHKLFWPISCPPCFVYFKEFDLVTLHFSYHFSCKISCLIEDLDVPAAHSMCWFFETKDISYWGRDNYICHTFSIQYGINPSPFKVSVAAFDDGGLLAVRITP